MAGSGPLAGQGALNAITLDPVHNPTVFTIIGEQRGNIGPPKTSRTITKVTPHNAKLIGLDTSVFGQLDRGVISGQANYNPNDTTLDHLTGMKSLMYSGLTCGLRIWGTLGVANFDEYICSGQVTSVDEMSPEKSGERQFKWEFQPSGPVIIDGVTIGVFPA